MQAYRCYFLTAAGTIRDVDEFECASDSEATQRATELLRTRRGFYAVEVWSGTRRVAEPLGLTQATG